MLSLGVGLTSVPVLARRGPAYDPDALAFFARLTTQPTETRKKLYSDLIASLKTAGVWSKLDALYILAAADAQAARQNLVANAFNLTAVGSPAFATDRGYTGDGATANLATGFNPSTAPSAKYTQDQATLASWVRSSNNGSYCAVGLSASGVTGSIRPNASGNLSVATNNATADTSAVVGSAGLSAWTRTASNSLKLYKNGALLATKTTASISLPNAAVTLLMLSNFSQFSVDQVAAASIAGPMSDSEHAAFHSALNIYMTAVGAN